MSAAPGPSGVVGQAYDVGPDGQRCLLKRQAGPSPIHAIVSLAARLPR
jgi:hypothetical protein